ncbi:MAG TPA: sigma-70 family RNA polymerase sigma factor [Gaiellales bacterium]|jgi:RNA polymerase sigma-70 factor (ECF subfamily)
MARSISSTLDAPDDAGAMAAVAAGDQEALRRLYERYGRLAHSIAYRISGDPAVAEECTQDTFVTLWRRADSFDPSRGQLSTWLVAIARNLALTAVRRRRTTVELDLDGQAGTDRAPDELIAAADAAAHVAEAMSSLPEPQLAVLQLAYFEGLSQSEIAERLGLPLGTVKGRVRLALERMRVLVHDDATVQGR